MHGIPFPVDRLMLSRIYEGAALADCVEQPFACGKIDLAYGPFLFPVVPRERCYTYGSFVVSIDGRIAYPSTPDGNIVAKSNRLDQDGGLCDYWILNLLRAISDAVVMGSMTLQREPQLTGRIYDGDLLEKRMQDGTPAVPLLVVVSGSGRNVPVGHLVYREPDIPTLTTVSPNGAANLASKHPGLFEVLHPVSSDADLCTVPGGLSDGGRNFLIGVGEGDALDPLLVLKVLRAGGVRRSLIETPTFLASLMECRALDELFLNTSGIFIGGQGMTIGQNFPPFTPECHPQARVVTMHSHSDSFFYTRYRFDYSGMQ